MATVWSESLAIRFTLLVTLIGVHLPDAQAAQHVEAVCVINAGPPGSQVSGVIVLSQDCPDGRLHVTGTVNNLAPNSEHGFHVHERGDLRNTTNPCLSTGAHYNPFGKHHGAPHDEDRHVGDLGNIQADASGIATVDKTDRLIQLCGPYSVIGRAIVVHANRDDLGTDAAESLTTGNSGARIGCCVIGIVQPVVLSCGSRSDSIEKPKYK